ncbi:hypothetical protein MUG78_09780 [Gordonia alkaliphila]|uniref:Uncharacterized protein n=1 Tax=Gordonia alkaliphila TaxID=1053547 RepID=A0ABP8YUZ3_9ACTN|nr:hypothetical protein [Gordonia alkaliphila]MCK0439742.1 hypothetical protein [Gordonia alkaliphila]
MIDRKIDNNRPARKRASSGMGASVAALAVSLVMASSLLSANASAETPAERCKRETAAYNSAWATSWVRAHPGTKPADAPPPPVPYRCGGGGGGGGQPPTFSPDEPAPPSSTATPPPSTSAEPADGSSGPSLHPSTERNEPANGVDQDQSPVGGGEREEYPDIPDDELRKLINISVRNFNTSIRKLRSDLQTFARQMSLPYSEVLSSAERNAFDAVQVSNPSADSTCGKPANQPVGQARGEGDFFYSDSCLGGYNHGHNGIFTSPSATMEASDDQGVHDVENAAASMRVNPQKYYVKSENATNHQKHLAAEYALSKDGKGYNSAGFANNRKGGPDVGHFNCSQLVWAAYYETSRIDLDKDSYGSWLGRNVSPNPGVYPKDLTGSPLVVAY